MNFPFHFTFNRILDWSLLTHPETHPQAHLNSTPTHWRHRDVAPPHTSSKVRRPPTLWRYSGEFSPFSSLLSPSPTSSFACTQSTKEKNLPHAGEAIPTSNISDPSSPKPIYGFGFWFVEEEHDRFGSRFWGAWRVGYDLGFGGGRSEFLGCHGGHQRGVVVLWVDLGSWGRG